MGAARRLPHRPRLLVVEDDDDLRPCIARALESNIDVACAKDEDEALSILETGEFDAVLTDYELKLGLGTELLERVSVRRPTMKRFLMSGREELEIEAPSRQWDGFFQKPFTADVIVTALNKRRD